VIILIEWIAVVRGIVRIVGIITVIGISLIIDRDISVVPVKGGGRRRGFDAGVIGIGRRVLVIPRVITSSQG
jgi:hypothetical protein